MSHLNSNPNSNLEIEIKLRLPSAAAGRTLLAAADFHVSVPRVLESNFIYDTADAALRSRGVMLRLRTAGPKVTLTFKGVPQPGKYKSRDEYEVAISSFQSFQTILGQLGYQIVFRYEKYRTEFISTNSGSGTITLDEAPIGVFLELEGSPEWIDGTARLLGFEDSGYLIASYGQLYLAYRREHGLAEENMIFHESAERSILP